MLSLGQSLADPEPEGPHITAVNVRVVLCTYTYHRCRVIEERKDATASPTRLGPLTQTAGREKAFSKANMANNTAFAIGRSRRRSGRLIEKIQATVGSFDTLAAAASDEAKMPPRLSSLGISIKISLSGMIKVASTRNGTIDADHERTKRGARKTRGPTFKHGRSTRPQR
nr:uncharacterized protein CTRU02_06164 [Colletotrichum truncatum]KAF6793292.1 hypothetical protein CTRU02_06164 [Colletotrichum truncatum]